MFSVIARVLLQELPWNSSARGGLHSCEQENSDGTTKQLPSGETELEDLDLVRLKKWDEAFVESQKEKPTLDAVLQQDQIESTSVSSNRKD